MADLFGQFVGVCKKYDLQKNKGTQQLFDCFIEVAYYIQIGQYEKNQFSRLEAAELIRVLQAGGSVEVSFGSHKAVVTNQILLASLYMFVNTDLYRQSAGHYSDLGIAKDKKPIKPNSEYLGVVFGSGDYVEPFTDEELKKIIKLEKKEAEKERLMLGNKDKKQGTSKQLPVLGYFVYEFLKEAPALFGEYGYNDRCELYPIGQTALQVTIQNNLIADLLVVTGAIECFKGKQWLEERWCSMNNSERNKEVVGWCRSYARVEKKKGEMLQKSIDESAQNGEDPIELITTLKSKLGVPSSVSDVRQVDEIRKKQKMLMFEKLDF